MRLPFRRCTRHRGTNPGRRRPDIWSFRVAYASALGLACIAAWGVTQHVMFTESESLRHRIFLVRKAKRGEAHARWQHVTFPLEHPYIRDGEPTLFTKVVRCLPGDTLRVTLQREIFCNDVLLGVGLETDSKGMSLPRWSYDGVVPEGKLFVMGTHERSFDSRYFGFVDASEVVNRAYPLW